MKSFYFFQRVLLVTSCWLLLIISGCQNHQKEIKMVGEWEVALDSLSTGPVNLTFNKTIQLPGTLAEASIGKRLSLPPGITRQQMFEVGLFKTVAYVGKAWYRKNITIPSWAKDKIAFLTMERIIWKSTVYIDGKEIGSRNSLSTPHKHNLTGFLTPGKHEIMICIDNTRQFNVGGGAQRTAWNGILGDFEINFSEKSYISDASVYPDAYNKNVRIKIDGQFAPDENRKIRFRILEKSSGKIIAESAMDVNTSNEYVLNFNTEIREWDEFEPNLYLLESSLIEKGKPAKPHTEVFGFKSIESSGKQILLNGNLIFLRGTAAARYIPPREREITDPNEWKKIFSTARAYGLNHFRFASGSPPEAAYEAADEMGFYLQVECPIWSLSFGKDSSVVTFITKEAHRIITEYGNHPSFCLMTLGNEMEGDYKILTDILSGLKAKDNRILFTTTTFTFARGHGRYPEPVDDYLITQYTDSGWVRGQGYFDSEYPSFDQDYVHAAAHIPVPIITHEVGQHTVFPDLKDIDKYNNVLTPVSLKDIKADMDKKGLLNLVDDYVKASGKLQVLLYKEDIERALKTSGISGFQLLGIFDVMGNSAFGGVLNSLWEPKKYVDSTEFRQFCSEMVPLAWFRKAVYSNAETFDAEVGIANFFRTLKNKKLICELQDISGNIVQRKEFLIPEITRGMTSKYGRLKFGLSDIKAPGQYKLSLIVDGTKYKNSWPVWVYPDKSSISDPEILVTDSFDEADKALNEGRKVLLSPPLEKLKGNTGRFITVFWSPTHFGGWVKRSQIGTMGLLIDPKHPAFSSFPAEFHSNWQWWDLCKHSESLEYDSLDIQPLVVVIDNYFKNRRLTNLFEVKVGNGKLVFSSIDLISKMDERIEARQLRHSLLQYMKSSRFDPEKSGSMKSVIRYFKDPAEIKTVELGPYD